MRLKLPEAPRSGDQVIVAEGLSKRYDDLTLFEDLDLTVFRGERVGIIGPNGVGKSTLVKCLLDEMKPDAGTVRLGARLSVGYYRQLHEHLDMSLTIWQYLQSVIVAIDGQAKASEQQARDLAGAFLFSGDEQDKTLADVSGGERSRAVLAGLVAGAHNLLVLDEPTNHLDIPASERLEQALSPDGGYAGSLLLISHDRALLESTCDRLLIFGGGGDVRQFQGHYTDWRRRCEREEVERRSARSAPGKSDQRDQRRKLEKRNAAKSPRNPLSSLPFEEIEKRIEMLERRRSEIDEEMGDPAVYSDAGRCRALQEERESLGRDLEPLEMEWTRRAEET